MVQIWDTIPFSYTPHASAYLPKLATPLPLSDHTPRPLSQSLRTNTTDLVKVLYLIRLFHTKMTTWAQPGFEPGTLRTQRANHTPRPLSHP